MKRLMLAASVATLVAGAAQAGSDQTTRQVDRILDEYGFSSVSAAELSSGQRSHIYLHWTTQGDVQSPWRMKEYIRKVLRQNERARG